MNSRKIIKFVLEMIEILLCTAGAAASASDVRGEYGDWAKSSGCSGYFATAPRDGTYFTAGTCALSSIG